MASSSKPPLGISSSAAFSFRGHPQPPPDERLEECKNYLADEDINRNLHFENKLGQIQEYIKELEVQKIDCNQQLLKDVKVMSKVHREWIDKFMDRRPCDKDCRDPDHIPRTSNRLISKEVGRNLREEREAWGLENQTREDHEPFTITTDKDREDHYKFLKKLREQGQIDPDAVDPGTHLPLEESQAYAWALNGPSMIPIWLHPRHGLPTKGVAATDKAPLWYRPEEATPTSSGGSSRRPPPQTLPEYLQKAQNVINDNLKAYVKGEMSQEQFARLEGWLRQYELRSLQALRQDLETLESGIKATPAIRRNIAQRRLEITEAHKLWLESFAAAGVQLMVGDNQTVQVLQPGVFYISPEEPSDEDLARIKRVQLRTNQLLSGMSHDDLKEKTKQREELASYFQHSWTPEMLHMFRKLSEVPTPTSSTPEEKSLSQDLTTQFAQAQIEFLSRWLGFLVELRYLLPGEIPGDWEDRIYIPWSPDKQLPEPPATSLHTGEDLNELRNGLNNFFNSGKDVYPGFVRRRDQKSIEKRLEKVMYPELRAARHKYLTLKSTNPSSAEYCDAAFFYHRACHSWINSFLGAELHVQPADNNRRECPELLFHRPRLPRADALELATRAVPILSEFDLKQIDENVLLHPRFVSNPEDSDLYSLLEHFQYPRLRRLDTTYREMGIKPDRTESEIRAEQKAKTLWRNTFNAWVASFERRPVQVAQLLTGDDLEGDPALLYYRGPLGDEDPDTPGTPADHRDPPLTRQIVDHSFLLLNSFINKAETEANLKDGDVDLTEQKITLAAQLHASSVLPPSLSRKLEEVKSKRAKRALVGTDDLAESNEAFTRAFSAWEKTIRDLARPIPTSGFEPPLPPSVQQAEDEINQLLQDISPFNPEIQERLNLLIQPYWTNQLKQLQEGRRFRYREEGKTDVEIDEIDLSIGAFSEDLNFFKMRCRARGFKLQEEANGRFVAQEPKLYTAWAIGRHVREHGLLEPSIPATHLRPASDYDNMTPNQSINYLGETEQKLQDLLRFHHRSPDEPLGDLDPRYNNYRDKFKESQLMDHLRPFFPHRIETAYGKLQRVISEPQPSSPDDRATFKSRKTAAIKTFLDVYEPWIRRLERSTDPLHLVFGTEQNLEDVNDGTLYIKRNPPSISKDTWADMGLTHPQPDQFADIEVEVNSLLSIHHETYSLTLEQEQRLRVLLRPFMPPDLRFTDHDLREMTHYVRSTGREKPAELQYYFNAVHRWQRDYYSWLSEFSGGPVRLMYQRKDDPEPKAGENLMYVFQQTEYEIERGEPEELKTLPRFMEAKQQQLNAFIQGATNLTTEQEEECRDYLYIIWEHIAIGNLLFEDWYEQFKTLTDKRRLPERPMEGDVALLQAVVYVQLQNSFNLFLEEFKMLPGVPRSAPPFAIEFTETQPENFEASLFPIDEEGNMTADTIPQEVIDKTLILKPQLDENGEPTYYYLPDVLVAALEEYISFNDHMVLNQGVDISEEDRAKLESLFQPRSRGELRKLEQDITRLWIDYRSSGDPKSKGHMNPSEIQRLKDLLVLQMWQTRGPIDPAERDSILGTTVHADPIDDLLNPWRRAGSKKLRRFPVDPPTHKEVLELNVAVEKLLLKCRKQTISPAEEDRLKWLMVPLLEPQIKASHVRLEELLWQRNNGITTTENLELVNLRILFRLSLDWFLSKIESLDALLSRWWISPKIMLAFYERNTLYNEAAKAAQLLAHGDKMAIDETPGVSALSEVSEAPQSPKKAVIDELKLDPKLRVLHDNRELLKLFATNYEGGYRQKLMLGHMNPPLKGLYEEIQSLREDANFRELDVEESLRLRTVTEDFVKDHMNWVSHLRPEQILVFQGEGIDYVPRAQRRGVQRAAIELGLNNLATNLEQHRVADRFRVVQLPPAYQPLPPEVPLWLPLPPHERRVELDPFHYTNLMQKYRRWKDADYDKARDRVIDCNAGFPEPPINYNGPYVTPTIREAQDMARRRHIQLTEIAEQLVKANDDAPRPLLQRLCILISNAINDTDNNEPSLVDDEPLMAGDLELFTELTQPSWNQRSREYRLEDMPGFDATELAQLKEFEAEVLNAPFDIPYWQPETSDDSDSLDQRPYLSSLPSSVGVDAFKVLQHELSNARLKIEIQKEAATPRAESEVLKFVWSTDVVSLYLRTMHDHRRVHFDAATGLVSRIPPDGHPENRYVESEQQARSAPYIDYDITTGRYEVQIDATGNVDTPTIQPNKFEHYQRLAIRLGRDIRTLAEVIAAEPSGDVPEVSSPRRLDIQQALEKALQYMEKANPAHKQNVVDPATGKVLSLQAIARDLLQIAPELRGDAGLAHGAELSEGDAARVINLQLIEELNNNWESRFPENEHVWDWVGEELPQEQSMTTDVGVTNVAVPRALPAPPRRFFDMRRWPVECQSPAVQTIIRNSGPQTQTQSQDPQMAQDANLDEETDEYDLLHPRGESDERWMGRGGPPHFPFGETGLAQLHLSLRMQADLRDVPEFQTHVPVETFRDKVKRRLAAPPPEPEFDDSPELPGVLVELPLGTVHREVKRNDVIERAKKTDGLPSEDHYYRPAPEVAHIERQKAEAIEWQKRNGIAAMVADRGMPWNKFTPKQKRESQEKFGIDPFTGLKLSDEEKYLPAEKVRKGLKRASSSTLGGPLKKTRSSSRVSAQRATAGEAVMSGGLGESDTVRTDESDELVEDEERVGRKKRVVGSGSGRAKSASASGSARSPKRKATSATPSTRARSRTELKTSRYKMTAVEERSD